MERTWLAAGALAIVALAVSCQNTDLGTTCRLVKRNPDGGTPLGMTGSDVTAQGQDLISFGSPECEDFICVRDLGERAPDAGEALVGYCSKQCVAQDTTIGCESDINKQPARPYMCRALLLDATTLSQLCLDQPILCQQYLGQARDAFFCARGLDAGP